MEITPEQQITKVELSPIEITLIYASNRTKDNKSIISTNLTLMDFTYMQIDKTLNKEITIIKSKDEQGLDKKPRCLSIIKKPNRHYVENKENKPSTNTNFYSIAKIYEKDYITDNVNLVIQSSLCKDFKTRKKGKEKAKPQLDNIIQYKALAEILKKAYKNRKRL
ncbi:3676_t:CDS:2 [Dentiscutata heterogama]|uniref:3676_t:CDS:1 n=1 Tax=Dentiscutata heterogama TaxID=1316150 RepID=A0ACA9KUH1_9GLOM|nr:3676_t:CDS:2 [Dentiscutata heterogama]